VSDDQRARIGSTPIGGLVSHGPSKPDLKHLILQGRSLFEDTKFGEELSDLGSVATDCLGDIRRAGGPEETDRRISDGGHYFGTGALSDPACVLPEGNVTHVMGAILD
jgi:hypothetical protein